MNKKKEVKITLVENNRAKKTLAGFIWYFVSSLFPALSSLIIFSLASRQITPAELGSITLATTIAMVLTSISATGFGDALIQFRNVEDKHLNTVFLLMLLTSTALYFLSLFAVMTIHLAPLDDIFKLVYPIIGVKIILDSCAVLPLSLLTKKMDFKSIGIRTIYCSLGSTLVCIPILLFNGGFWAVVISQMTSSLISAIILWSAARIKPKFSFDKQSFHELKAFGITTTFTKLVTSISVDNIVIGFFGNAITLGVYAFSRRIFSVVSDVLNGALSSVSYPLYASVQADIPKLKNIFLKTTFISALVSLPAFLGLMLISPYLVPLVFGEHWSVAIEALQICCTIGFLACIGTLQMSLLKGLGKTSWILKYQLIQQISTGILALIFAKYGATYVMGAIALKTYCIWPFTIIYISKCLELKIKEYIINLYKPIVGGLVMFIAFRSMAYYSSFQNPLLFILMEIIFCAAIYIIVMLMISKKELLSLVKLIKR
ncbi:oligosaccharide flippase family protein [Sodalis sp. C49]|uniref:oligosaccharide flippase family protein n=1 Tax=Sodalis sp. C49 TaxID=3228929 RepID=UPI0039659FF8